MRILLLGASGQLGRALFISLSSEASSWQLIAPDRGAYSLVNCSALSAFIGRVQPDVIINAVAYTQVDKAEGEPELAFRINSQVVVMLAEAAKRVEALLVHFSTDYVFDGSGVIPWCEEDLPAPLNIYGQSKLQGEQAILASGCRHLILRTSRLYSPYRNNFVKTMLRLGQEQESLSVVCDQIGAPTSATMLAEVTLGAIKQTLANPALCGLYHVAAKGETSWFDYARFIFAEAEKLGAKFKLSELNAVPSHAYPVAARRPLNSRLDTAKFCAAFGIVLPPWQLGVIKTLEQLTKPLD